MRIRPGLFEETRYVIKVVVARKVTKTGEQWWLGREKKQKSRLG